MEELKKEALGFLAGKWDRKEEDRTVRKREKKTANFTTWKSVLKKYCLVYNVLHTLYRQKKETEVEKSEKVKEKH